MNDVVISREYVLVVDTDQPATFADELTAYCTGLYAEYASPRVKEIAELYYSSQNLDVSPFRDYLTAKQNSDGDWTPGAVWANRRYGINAASETAVLDETNYGDYDALAGFSVGIYLTEPLPEELLKTFKDRAAAFLKGKAKVEGCRLITHTRTGSEVQL